MTKNRTQCRKRAERNAAVAVAVDSYLYRAPAPHVKQGAVILHIAPFRVANVAPRYADIGKGATAERNARRHAFNGYG